MKLQVLILVAVQLLTGMSYAATDCSLVSADAFRSVNSKPEMENAIAETIRSHALSSGGVDWQRLSECFDSLGERFDIRFVADGFEGAHVFRFTVDRSNALTWLLGAPGGSNGVYTAIVSRSADGRIEIIRRGGEREFLLLDR